MSVISLLLLAMVPTTIIATYSYACSQHGPDWPPLAPKLTSSGSKTAKPYWMRALAGPVLSRSFTAAKPFR